MAEPIRLQGPWSSSAPHEPGLYAWYYSPLGQSEKSLLTAGAVLARLMDEPLHISTNISLRYFLRWEGVSQLSFFHGGVQAGDKIQELLRRKDPLLIKFLFKQMVPVFSRPLYIGIARDLHRRVYAEHYLGLCEYWEEVNPVSKYLDGSPMASVQEVMSALSLPHSFALEARVRGLPPRDLSVFVLPTVDVSTGEDDSDRRRRREVEQVLQLLTEPVCGRR